MNKEKKNHAAFLTNVGEEIFEKKSPKSVIDSDSCNGGDFHVSVCAEGKKKKKETLAMPIPIQRTPFKDSKNVKC